MKKKQSPDTGDPHPELSTADPALRAPIEAIVMRVVSTQMGVSETELRPETAFINDLNADSLDTVELVMEFEDIFEISVPDEEAEKLQTISLAVDYLCTHLKEPHSVQELAVEEPLLRRLSELRKQPRYVSKTHEVVYSGRLISEYSREFHIPVERIRRAILPFISSTPIIQFTTVPVPRARPTKSSRFTRAHLIFLCPGCVVHAKIRRRCIEVARYHHADLRLSCRHEYDAQGKLQCVSVSYDNVCLKGHSDAFDFLDEKSASSAHRFLRRFFTIAQPDEQTSEELSESGA